MIVLTILGKAVGDSAFSVTYTSYGMMQVKEP
jgi:hypothetical protein